MIYKAPKSEWT